MANKKELKEVISGNVVVTIVKDWQHPHGTLKPIGTELTVTKEGAEELVAEGYAEIKTD